MNNIIRQNNYLTVYLILLLILNLFLINFPLTNVFGYKFSAINAIAVSFLSGIYVILILKHSAKDDEKIFLSKLIKNYSFFLIVPFLVSVINSLFTGFCSFTDGLLFYIVLTVPSVAIGMAIGITAFSLVPKFKVVIFIFIFVLILLISLLVLYFNPQVYLYNPIFGYFPGTIYDEGLSVDSKLIIYRLFNLVFFVGLFSVLFFFFSKNYAKKFFAIAILISLGVVIVFIFAIAPGLGYTTTFSKLKVELSSRVETKHFVIYADQQIDIETLKLIALNHEYHYAQLSDFFDEKPDGKINSFVFKSREQKKKLFGSGAADVAKPWQNSIFISLESWEETLKHELAHCFAGNFGEGLFKIAGDLNPALIEGIAEAANGFYDEHSIHSIAAIAFHNGYKVDISSLFSSLNFFGNVSGLSYIYAGSFVEYLIEKFGIEKFKQYYKSNEFEKTYGIQIGEAVKEYEKFLTSYTSVENSAIANYYFGRTPLIKKVCPRFISDRLKDAWRYYEQGNFKNAENLFDQILDKTDNYSAIIGLSLIYENTNLLQKTIDFLKSKIEIFNGTSYEYDLKFRLADLYAKNHQLEEAGSYFKYILQNKPDNRMDILSKTRLMLIEQNAITEYVSGSDSVKYSILKQVNYDLSVKEKKYFYFTIPLMIDLSKSFREDYRPFLKNFRNNFIVNDYYSSYALFKLSRFMLENFDYSNARKIAGLSLRYDLDEDLPDLLKENFNKCDWFYRNAENVLNEMEIVPN